jgi:D-alanine-D-alanine ligase-like ATP-grasp enzyme
VPSSAAERICETVILEQFCPGDDLRVIVIDFEVVAAAIRRPAHVVGNGQNTVNELIQIQSRRRRAATGGESSIPMDDETERCVLQAGYKMEDIPPEGETLIVRKTANLHTGGTIHDCTTELSPALAEAARKAARELDIPVTGLDFLVPDVSADEYVIIEANERPGLANHEPQPTASASSTCCFRRPSPGSSAPVQKSRGQLSRGQLRSLSLSSSCSSSRIHERRSGQRQRQDAVSEYLSRCTSGPPGATARFEVPYP